jgi:hypothetical protein
MVAHLEHFGHVGSVDPQLLNSNGGAMNSTLSDISKGPYYVQ